MYSGPESAGIDKKELTSYLKRILPHYEPVFRPEFLFFHKSDRVIKKLAREFAGSRVRNPSRKNLDPSYLPGEIDYEVRRIAATTTAFGIPYEGLRVMAIYKRFIKKGESRLSTIHIAFTNQFLATWEDDDARYHLRAALYGYPSIISTTGLVEAPAKPREYYLLKGQYQALGAYDAAAHLEEEFRGRFLSHDDANLTEVIKGYSLQAVANQLLGNPFCSNKNCRLYNAHWQEEMLQAQSGAGNGLCRKHRGLFSNLAKG